MVKKIIYVSACVIVDIDNRILVATREHKSDFKTYWEFPGGKLNKNETPEDCLIREIKEEINIDISKACIAPIGFFFIFLFSFTCSIDAIYFKKMERRNITKRRQQIEMD